MTKTQGQQWLVFANITANHPSPLQLRKRRNAGTQPPDMTVMVEIGCTQTRIDVVTTQTTQQFSAQIQLFQGAVWTGQAANSSGAMVSLDSIQTVGDIFQSHLPIHGLPLAALLDHGLRQAFRAVERFIAVAVAVGNPALVDFFIFKRNHTQNLMVFDLHDQVGASGVVWTDGFASS